jgi:hypothetical protein
LFAFPGLQVVDRFFREYYPKRISELADFDGNHGGFPADASAQSKPAPR